MMKLGEVMKRRYKKHHHRYEKPGLMKLYKCPRGHSQNVL